MQKLKTEPGTNLGLNPIFTTYCMPDQGKKFTPNFNFIISKIGMKNLYLLWGFCEIKCINQNKLLRTVPYT